MGRVNTFGILCLLSAIALAGCAEETGPAAASDAPESVENLDLVATEDTGVIRGVVVDEAVVPVGGATITLLPGEQTTTSSDDGGFGFSNVDPGFATLVVDAVGYYANTIQVEVVAGDERPPITRIRLTADYSELPAVEAHTFNGYIMCSGSTPAYRVAICAVPNIVSDILGQEPLTEDDFIRGFEIGMYPDFIQSEMTWKSTQAAGEFLMLTAEVSPSDGEEIGTVSGRSPLTLRADNATIAAAGMDVSKWMQVRVFNMEHEATASPVPVCGVPNPVHGGDMCIKGAGLTIDQSFQVFTHVFHKFTPGEDWTFIEDGAPTVPN